MGKIFTRVTPGMAGSHINGIDVLVVDQLFGALSGATSITKIDKDPASGSLLIEAENDNFLDGTEIVGNWTTGNQTPNPGTAVPQYTVFSGVKIIDPTAQKNTRNATITFTSTYSPSSSYTLPANGPYYYAIGGNITQNNVPATTSKDVSSSKCDCGADSVGGAHSSYCSKK